MAHPFQRIVAVPRCNQSRNDLVLLACGANLISVDIITGETISTWISEGKSKISILKVSDDSHYVALVTGEDKAVHVLALEESGALKHLSERRMPKRPCAIAFSPDITRILCGDKFGDVYALPVLYTSPSPLQKKTAEPEPKPFKPSANNATVHTQRNLKALEAQLKAKNKSPKSQETLEFDHELLLGHVSMLTDILCAIPDTNPAVSTRDQSKRYYILTADRDEHIRVSRSPPQAYIINNYCLGHTQFISKLCIATNRILVSGGGDDYLLVWDWLKGRIIRKVDLREAIRRSELDSVYSQNKIAVSGLWKLSPRTDAGNEVIDIICACEGLPLLLHLILKDDPATEFACDLTHTMLPGNVLDVTSFPARFIVSIDNILEPASTEVTRTQALDSRLLKYTFRDNHINQSEPRSWVSEDFEPFNVHAQDSHDKIEASEMGKFLYTVESLRKYGNDDS